MPTPTNTMAVPVSTAPLTHAAAVAMVPMLYELSS